MALIGNFHYFLAKKNNSGEKLLTLSPPIHSHFMLCSHYLNLQISSLQFFWLQARKQRNIIFVSRELTFTHKKGIAKLGT